MIFDSVKAEKLYRTYTLNNNPQLVEEIHTLAGDLIKVIANTLDQGINYEDLIQEGHLKLHRIIINHKFKPGKCPMYNFLSTALRNAMIDYMRKSQQHEQLEEDYESETYEAADMQEGLFTAFYLRRFPSLPQGGYEPASYVRDAIIEQANKSKIIRTLMCCNDLEPHQASTVCNSVTVFLRTAIVLELTDDDLYKPLNYANNGREFTLYPEAVLLGIEEDRVLFTHLLESVNSLRDNGEKTH